MIKNETIKISIIVPVYNGEKYIQECIDSLLKQTYNNIEIIIIDDGSTDSTNTILKKYEECESRVVVIRQENQGTSAARNAGLKVAQGEFVTFVDSDDYLLPDCIERIVEAIANSSQVSLVVWNSMTFGDGDEIRSNAGDQIFTGRDYIKYILENRGGTGGVCCKAYNTSVIKDNHLKFHEFKTAEDGHFNTACLKYLDSIVSLSYIGYMYRKEDYYIHSTTKFFKRKDFFKSSVESAAARLALLRDAMQVMKINEKKYTELYYESEYYTFQVVKDENIFHNDNFIDKIKCNKLLLEKVVTLRAIEIQKNIWSKKWLCYIYKKKSGIGLMLWHFSQIHNIKVAIVNTILGKWFPKNTTRGKTLRKIFGR